MPAAPRLRFSYLVQRVALACACGLTSWAYAADMAPDRSVATPTVKAANAQGKSGVQVASKATAAPSLSGAQSAGPQWVDLSPAQQLALKPLSANWNSLTDAHKRKWLALSKNFARLSETEQAKLQSRMTDWVALSSQQRAQARVNYAQSKAISPAEKQAKWQEYQALSAEEKRKLASKAPGTAKGAAPALKPPSVPPLTTAKSSRSAPAGAAATAIDKNTLLPTSSKISQASVRTEPSSASGTGTAPHATE